VYGKRQHLGANHRPQQSVGGKQGSDHIAAPFELDPSRCVVRAAARMHARQAGREAALECDSLRAGHEHGCVRRVGCQRFAHHHAGFGPVVDARQAGHSRDDIDVAGDRLVGEPELIGRVPDVCACGLNGKRSAE
jgi:hypothetical protein